MSFGVTSYSFNKVKEDKALNQEEDCVLTGIKFNVKFNERLKDAIYELFIKCVDAKIIVDNFKKYSSKVLLATDIEIVKSKAENKGNKEANEELLERLVKYSDWFPCLIQCLKDPIVNQCYLAEQLLEIEASVKNEFERDLQSQKLQELNSPTKENTDKRLFELSKPFKKDLSSNQLKDSELSKEDLQLTKKIGEGSTACVWQGKMYKKIDVAVKSLSSTSISDEEFLREAEILSKLKDKRIIKFLGYVQSEESIYIVTELMSNGTLLDFFKTKQGKELKYKDVLRINVQICEGMNFIEFKNIVHRDLRAANILVGCDSTIKISDFGSACIVNNDIAHIPSIGIYKIKWTAPEAILKKTFSSKSDVWSFGVVMYETVTLGGEPYPNMSDSEVLKMVNEGIRMIKPVSKFEIPLEYYNTKLMCWNPTCHSTTAPPIMSRPY